MQSALPDDAFSALYREHFPYVWAVLRRLGAPVRDVEDLVQEVFVVVHRRLDQFEGRASVRTWLYAIAVRVFWNDRRRRAHRPEPVETPATLTSETPVGDPEDFAARRQANALLHDLLGNLDDDKRTVFVLAELEGMTAPAIAKITGAPTRTVYSRLRAARDRFSADLRRMQVREENGMRARELLRCGAPMDRPRQGVDRRVWGALAVRLAEPAVVPLTVGAFGSLGATGTAAASLALGVVGLGILYGGAQLLRGDPPAAPPPVEVTSRQVAVPAAVLASSAPPAPVAAPVATRVERSAAADEDELVREHPDPSQDEAGPGAGDPLQKELTLMGRVRTALKRSDPETALELLDEHARDFPSGRLAPERRRSRVTALCQANRAQEAAELAKSLGLDPRCPER